MATTGQIIPCCEFGDENGIDPAQNEFAHPTDGLERDDEKYSVPDFEIEPSDWCQLLSIDPMHVMWRFNRSNWR